MFKSLRVPERLFQIAMWAVSVVFAGFLIGLGGKVVGDLPGVDQTVSQEQFVDSAKHAQIRGEIDSLTHAQQDVQGAQERAQLQVTAATNAYQAGRDAFTNWIATRTATIDPKQDPEVISRTRQLDGLKATERSAQADAERLDAQMLQINQALEQKNRDDAYLYAAAEGQYNSALFSQQLHVFLVRLAITLPLLIFGGWLFARKRKSEYWPLARGFVLFALFTFFVELVPYLPSYGGYVRYGVGVIVSALAGVYVIRAMRVYLAKRAEAEQRTETERRRTLSYEAALRSMAVSVCPGCERAIVNGPDGKPSNFCVHCGMTLYDDCKACHSHKNAFFQYCPVCGAPASPPTASEPAPARA